jgi:hypothetical protein
VRDLARNIGVVAIADGLETTEQLEEQRLLERDPRW